MTTRRALLAAPLAAPALASAQGRTTEVIIPYPPGGGVDIVARLGFAHAGARLPGMRFAFVNRPGASGQIGNEAIFNAAADGLTLGALGNLSIWTQPLERPCRWRAEDFTAIANVVEDPSGLFVRADSPLRSLDDLIRALRGRPESVSVGSAAGVGSDDHLVLLALEEAANIRALHAPYNGTALVQRDLLTGALQVASFNMGESTALLREGRIRALGQAAATRWSGTADVPTFKEQGFDVVIGSSRGIVGPPGMPAELVERLRDAFRQTFADPRFTLEAERASMPLRPLVGEDFRQLMLAEGAWVRALYARRPWSREG